MTRVTLADVAAHASVSKATVSMVLNDSPLVAAATRERVRESLVLMGYVYNRAAASLRKGQTMAIGVIVTTLTNPYFAEFTESIQEELDGQGLDVLLGVSGDDLDRQQRLLLSMAGRRVDGIVMVPAPGTTAEIVVPVETPLLMLTRRVPGLDLDYVGADNVNGMRAAVDHLIQVHGARRLAFFGGVPASSRDERMQGFADGIAAHEVDVEIVRIGDHECRTDRRAARAAARGLLAGGNLDAVVCYNDVVAFGVMDAAAEMGLKVGRDLRITGFDDIDDAAFFSPTLTSLAVPARTTGVAAASMLQARIRGDHTEALDRILPATLVARESCGCA